MRHLIAVMLATLFVSPALAQDGPPSGPWEGHGEEKTDEIFYGFAAVGMGTGIVVASRMCSDDRRRRIGLGLESAGICRESRHWSRLWARAWACWRGGCSARWSRSSRRRWETCRRETC